MIFLFQEKRDGQNFEDVYNDSRGYLSNFTYIESQCPSKDS
jgi:hypothetical protein